MVILLIKKMMSGLTYIQYTGPVDPKNFTGSVSLQRSAPLSLSVTPTLRAPQATIKGLNSKLLNLLILLVNKAGCEPAATDFLSGASSRNLL